MPEPNPHLAIINTLVDAFPRQSVTPQTVRVYLAELGDLDPHELMAAARRHIATSKWFPHISELREAVIANRREIRATWPAEVEAWKWALEHAASSGEWVGGDPRRDRFALAVEAVQHAGGWRAFGQTTDEDRHWFQRRFVEAYRQLLESAEAREQLPGSVLAELEERRGSMGALDVRGAMRAIGGGS